MEEYLRDKYLKTETKKKKKNPKSNIKIYDEEDDERDICNNKKKKKTKINVDFGEDNSDSVYYGMEENSDTNSDVPIIVTNEETMDIIQLSKKNKKKILNTLNNSLENVCHGDGDGDDDDDKKKQLKNNKKKKTIKQKKDINYILKKKHHNTFEKKESCENVDGWIIKNDYKSGSKKYDLEFKDHVGMNDGKRKQVQKDCTKVKEYSNSKDSVGGNSSSSDLSIPRKGVSRTPSSGSDRSSSSDLSIPRKGISRTSSSSNGGSSSSSSSGSGRRRRRQSISKSKKEKKKNNYDPKENKKEDDTHDTIYRNKEGKIISKEEWINNKTMSMEKNKNKRKKVDSRKILKDDWCTGLTQKKIREDILKNNEKIITKKNIIKYNYDSDYDKELKMRKRKEDPMNIYLEDSGESENIENNKKMKCPHQTPYNRFTISAGYRWDGIIRGNGFEERRYKLLLLQQHQQKLAYMNNVSDL
ncbi:pre-mRNA-splicing factor CWC26, putative [Hepatocystis sp. ex Piliocolobus tephrosceles]|nr:pre-mRNA-splicing factor CWC26, putative [Hepatocystis sp. ex Piliocolobus tephrosceles]